MSQMPITQNAAAQLAIFANPDALETVREIMSSEDFSASDLDRIKVPGAGGLMWEIPTAEGSRDSREIRGIILLSKTGRAYWQSKYSGENSKPDCVSLDGQCGTGNPGGQCAACPFNQYESAAEGSGKACKETRTLLVLQEDELIPTVLRVPPSSIKELKQFLLRLAKKGLRLSHVASVLTLERDKSAGGITYSKIKFAAADALTPEQRKAIDPFTAAFAMAFDRAHASTVTERSGGAEQGGNMPTGEEQNPFGA